MKKKNRCIIVTNYNNNAVTFNAGNWTMYPYEITFIYFMRYLFKLLILMFCDTGRGGGLSSTCVYIYKSLK